MRQCAEHKNRNSGNFWSCSPLNIVNIENSHFYYVRKKGNNHVEHFNQN